MVQHLGNGVLGLLAGLYGANDLLIVGLGVYDWITRRRLHRAYLGGVAWILANNLTAIGLSLSPWWRTIALRIIGH